tara:strand:- start:1978 stop:2196 length:219 start_codon:yes stop_codon:yes gene_type:complete
MKKPDDCKMEYCGYKEPKTFEEINFELLGLKNLIKKAEERITMLEQSSFLAKIAIEGNSQTLDQYFNIEKDK